MKIFFYLLFMFLITSSAHSREYCDEGLKILDPIGDRNAMTILLLESELECLGKLDKAKKFKKQVEENFKKVISESMPMYPKGSNKKWRECGAKYLDNDIKNLRDPVKNKRYQECETKRIDALWESHVKYSLNLFYSFLK